MQHRMVKQINIDLLTKILSYKSILYKIPIEDLLPNIDISDLNNINICTIKQLNNFTFGLVYVKNKNDDYPIWFIVYIDNKNRIRAYVPKHGNLYNPWCLTAFGNESVFSNSRKSLCLMPEKYYMLNKEDGLYKETEQYNKDFIKKRLHENLDKMYYEFINLHTLEEIN